MFSKQVRVIFRVLAQALLTLANMPADADEIHVEMTGAQYINELDNPATGKELPDATTGTAAQVFAAEPGDDEFNPLLAAREANAAAAQDPASVFGIPGGPAPGGAPTYTMTAKAEGFAREDFHKTGWTDEALVDAEIMIITPAPVALDTRPNAPPAPAAGTPQVPSAQPTASTSAAAPAAPANTAAPGHAGAVTTDGNGLPWDARIHSSSRAVNADGGWKKKKGVGDVEVARVTAELRASGPAPVVAPFTPLAAAAPAPQTAAPAPQTAAAPAPAGELITEFAPLCKWITASGFTMGQALEHAKQYGIEAMGFLAQPSNAAFIPLVHEALLKQRQA